MPIGTVAERAARSFASRRVTRDHQRATGSRATDLYLGHGGDAAITRRIRL